MKTFMVFIIGIFLLFPGKVWAVDSGLGICHWPATAGMAYPAETVSWFYWGGGIDWAKIEPVRGRYNFGEFDKLIVDEMVKPSRRKFWLDVQQALDASVPQWAKNEQYGMVRLTSKRVGFAVWNKNYQAVTRELLEAIKKHLDDPTSAVYPYRDMIEAINIMAGGPSGEMITYVDTSSSYYAGMTKVGYDYALEELVENWDKFYFPDGKIRDTSDFADGKNYRKGLLEIIDIYSQVFWDKPIVLQVSTGLRGRVNFYKNFQPEVVGKYGSRVWLKYNGWSDSNSVGQTNGRHIHEAFAQVADKTRVGFEPGWFGNPDQSAPAVQPADVIFESILNTIDSRRVGNRFYVPTSYMCFQEPYYKKLSKSQWETVASLIKSNRQKELPPWPILTYKKVTGDANGDYKVNLVDMGIWKAEYLEGSGTRADFNNNGVVDLADMAVWKLGYLTN